ncbi:unnamed protein product [Heligmosomoides polygyrus]|uniref:UDENN domain-containing protein n=1 Tax=Heligmosomoides polygyrus TaxID=6339 RepID=A0A3P8FUG6_HELPZ|nr:unnamed protein product [Heligmosomoides polygyrus]
MQQILHVVVVGFHHKKGCQPVQVEFSYPQLDGNCEGGLPEEWIHLPSLALPDGAHNTTDENLVLLGITIRSLDRLTDKPDKPVILLGGELVPDDFREDLFIGSLPQDLVAKTDDVTRSTVQKSVCVLSRAPLFGALKAKLELITRAYFAERDFTKVEVLSQMYNNLCEMFNGSEVDGQAASMGKLRWKASIKDTILIRTSLDISVQDLFVRFRHRTLVLFKLLLLERKVVFNISPAQLLGTTMLALVSLYPKMLEEGLRFCCATYTPPKAKDKVEKATKSDGSEEDSPTNEGAEIIIPPSVAVLDEEPKMKKDNYGFPLSIFTKGNLFHPYLSISYLDMIRSKSVRGFAIGATNALFVTKRDLLDAIVTVCSFLTINSLLKLVVESVDALDWRRDLF